jgi:type II secretory pathway component GspD/PulD (secretin)
VRRSVTSYDHAMSVAGATKRSWIRAIVAVTVMLAFGCNKRTTAPPVSQSDSTKDKYAIPLIQFLENDLKMVADNLAHQWGINFVLDPATPDKPITLRWEKISAEDALKRLAKEHGLFLLENKATTVTRISTTNRVAAPINERWVLSDKSIELPFFAFDSSDLAIALNQLAKHAGIRITIDPAVSNTPLQVKGTPNDLPSSNIVWERLKPRQAIGGICENFDLVLIVQQEGESVRITPLPNRH